MTSLTAAALPDISVASGNLAVPTYPLEKREIGVVHFGVGGFHRAHQAFYLDRLFNAGHAPEWAICGVGLMPGDKRMRDSLTAQDGLYTLVAKAPDGSRDGRVIGSIAEFLYAPEAHAEVLGRLTDPTVRMVTLTVTEGGYNYNQSTGDFLFDTPEITADLAADFAGGSAAPKTLFGYLVEGLRRRREAGVVPFTVVSCDNIRGNGHLTKKMVMAYAGRKDAELAQWIGENVSFPNCMVDRITPVTSADDQKMVAADYGVDDAWPAVCEDFIQWVLEDDFPAGRPPLEEAGVQMVDDVEPYELMKLRLLNCSHQAIGYLGQFIGGTYAHDAVGDPQLAYFTRTLYMDGEGTPAVPPVPGIDLQAYKDQLMERFGNVQVKDTLARIATGSSDRISTWVMPVVRDNLAAGRDVSICAAVVAAYARYMEGTNEDGAPLPINDRLAERMTALAGRHEEDIFAVLRDPELFGDIIDYPEFTEPYRKALTTLRERGARALLEDIVGDAGA